MSYFIVLADDYFLLRKHFRTCIETKKELKVIGDANIGSELIELLNKLPTNMIILDIMVLDYQTIEIIKEIKKLYPDVKVLVLSIHRDKQFLSQVISAGADGYLCREEAKKELISAIELVQQGKNYISPLVSQEFRDIVFQTFWGQSETSPYRLTNREKEILCLIGKGKSSKEISQLLSISVRTVEKHRQNIIKKIQIKRNAHLIAYALNKGYVSNTS